jgi:hypothetical protein
MAGSPVCPDCELTAGGESSDFNGDESPCSAFYRRRPVTLDEAAQLGFDADELQQVFAAQPIRSPFAWSAFTDFIPGERQFDIGSPPTGYQSQTSIEVTLRPTGGVTHRDYDSDRCDAAGVCRDPSSGRTETCVSEDSRGSLLLDAEVELATTDGAIAVMAPVVLTSRSGGGFMTAFRSNLRRVSGSLRMAPGRSGPYVGELYGNLFVRPGNVRGLLYPEITSAVPTETDEWRHRPLQGNFPSDDDCPVHDDPVDPDSPEGQAITQRAATLYARMQSLPMAVPSVRWSAGATTSVELELPSLARTLCVSADGSITISGDVSVKTNDGRLSWATRMLGRLREERASDPAELQFSTSRYLEAEDSFWASNAQNIELLGSEMGRVFLGIDVVDQPGRANPTAAFWVMAIPDCDQDPRCNPDDASTCTLCGQPYRVDGFDSIPPPVTPPEDAAPAAGGAMN